MFNTKNTLYYINKKNNESLFLLYAINYLSVNKNLLLASFRKFFSLIQPEMKVNQTKLK